MCNRGWWSKGGSSFGGGGLQYRVKIPNAEGRGEAPALWRGRFRISCQAPLSLFPEYFLMAFDIRETSVVLRGCHSAFN